MPLDIEHLFDAGWRQNRTDVPVADVPDDGRKPKRFLPQGARTWR
jgi:hypothetical protein